MDRKMSRYTVNDNNNCFNSTNYIDVWNNYTVADDRSQLLAWLSPLEPKLRHRAIQERRVCDMGKWLIETEEFRIWHDWSDGEGDKAVLFCYGAPGVGKTFISSLVVDKLCDQARGQNTAVACFYFDFAARKEQSATNMLGSVLKQIVSGMEKVPEEISQAFQEQKMAIGGRGPRLQDIVKMLQAVTSSLRTFVCIDALDECTAVHRVKLLDSLKQIFERSPRTRIFIIGRPHIRAEVESRLARRVISLSVSSSKDDIIGYLRVRLDEDETPEAMDESLAADILKRIPEKMSEMFLLVSLNIDAILHESTIYRRRERLRKMIDGLELGNAYSATIERIKAQDGDKSRLGMMALMWIRHAERPLQADELCYALAVELGSTDFNFDNIPSISILVGCCQELITVDKEGSTVRLIHFTLQEYFWAHPDIFNRPHSAMAEICLTYLNSRQVKALSTIPSSDTDNTLFLEYCSVYWGVHARRELSDYARSLALNLCREDYGHISTKFLLAHVERLCCGYLSTFYPFSGLHCASFFGIVEVVSSLIELGCHDINEIDFSGCTPLSWAAHNGNAEVVKILLGRGEGVDLDKPDNNGRTPLSFACWNGHEGVMKLLLGREEVDPNKPDNNGRTPLWYAALNEHEVVVKALLGRQEVNPDRPDNRGITPLSCAAWNGHEVVVKILLGQEEVNPEKPDNRGQTPLSLAACDGHEGVVKMLLGLGVVDPDKPDNTGKTPLSYAAWYGHEGVVRTLLRREEINPDKPDNYGLTPLFLAARNGHEEVLKILLELEEVNPDKLDNCGRTPLSFAARAGHEGVVKILLGRPDISPDRSDNNGKTPLWFAARRGHEQVVNILLGRKDVSSDKPDNEGQTPLSIAASYGHKGVVFLLRSHRGVARGAI